MTPEQIVLVQTSFASIAPIASTIAALFYHRLFYLDPTLEHLFPRDLGDQRDKLIAMLQVVVNGLDQLEAIVPAVQALGRRHRTYGAVDAHYTTVGAALLWTLRQALGDYWTPEVEAAWAAAFALLATTMQAATST